MHTKKLILAIVLFFVIIIGLAVLAFVPSHNAHAPTGNTQATTTPTTATEPAHLADLIVVTSPLPHATVTSPLVVTGQARGNWYFEASAPVELRNAAGAVIAQGHVEAQGDWMTTEYVPFTAILTFPAQAPGSVGMLVLKNDNPSGDPAREKELDIPVHF
ncbi:MAG: Gmad2 immunoglobulin-like domain-containing protein [Candidatus Adlerbacteria bacterium]|nr:Gmad2 immunoglobulin-like domain-containing protein [Candidatus Adlerbacteria bacterium]